MRRGGTGGGGVELTGRPADIEASSGVASLLTYARDRVAGLAAAESWAAAHQLLAREGLVFAVRGAGLVIEAQGSRASVRASAVARSLSLGQLAARWGEYTPPPGGVMRVPYPGAAALVAPGAADLFARYRKEQSDVRADRSAATAAVSASHADYLRKLDLHYRARRARVPLLVPPMQRRAAYAALAAERQADLAAQRAVKREQLETARAAAVPRSWIDWLRLEAAAGDTDALVALRTRERREAANLARCLRSGSGAAQLAQLRTSLRPTVSATGAVCYQVADGGRVEDLAGVVRVASTSAAADALALALAVERFQGEALVIDGDDAFGKRLAALAGRTGVSVRFADPALDAVRAASVPPARPAPVTAARPAADALDRYVEARNALRGRVSGVLPHSRFTASDAGTGAFRGLRKLDDGSEAAMIEREGRMLALPITTKQGAMFSRVKIGSALTFDGKGRIVGGLSRKGR